MMNVENGEVDGKIIINESSTFGLVWLLQETWCDVDDVDGIIALL